MSPSIDSALSQWLAQLTEMQTALAELKETRSTSGGFKLDKEIEEELDNVVLESRTTNVEDLISHDFEEEAAENEEEITEISNKLNNVAIKNDSQYSYDAIWLQSQCERVQHSGSELDAEQLFDQIATYLASNSSSKNRHHYPCEIRRYF